MTQKKTVQFRLNEADRAQLDMEIRESGLSTQSYIENAVKGVQIIPREQLDDLNENLAGYYRAVRGIATNINQMAHIANETANVPAENELQEMQTDIMEICRVTNAVWSEVREICREERRRCGHTKSDQ